MAMGGMTYSRMIAWLKILLPLAALVLLSTLFLFARPRNPIATLPFATTTTTAAALWLAFFVLFAFGCFDVIVLGDILVNFIHDDCIGRHHGFRGLGDITCCCFELLD